MTDALQLRDNAKYELEQIKDLETGVEYLNKVEFKIIKFAPEKENFPKAI